jgi:molybdopterin/thiamine biosynthesis adenylyltransferase
MTHDSTYRPSILRPSSATDAERIEELMRTDGIEVLDSLEAQIADLIRTRHPSKNLGPADLAELSNDFKRGNGGDDYGVWVHYPWSRRLVRLLAQEEFIELRTDRNKQKITASEQARLAGCKVGIVGLSVGQSVALTIAMERTCAQLRLADFDTIDLSNLNRLRCGVHMIGLPKTIAAAREIAELDPYIDVVCFSDGFSEANANDFLSDLDLVVDECDSIDIKIALRELARDRRIPLVMSTSDRGMVDIERFDVEPDRPIFHGRLDGLSGSGLADLTTEQKVPVLMKLAGLPEASLRMRASLLEIGHSIKTWPQLASDVTFGGAAVCDVARRILLEMAVASGCYRMDFQVLGDAANAVQPAAEPACGSTPPLRSVPKDAVESVLLDAVQAPSAGNAQPWQWTRTSSGLSLAIRPLNHKSVLYAGQKVDLVALGASLETALISARHRGFAARETIMQIGAEVARIDLSVAGNQTTERLFAQIPRRRSNRLRPERAGVVPTEALDRMTAEIAGIDDVELRWLTDRRSIEGLGFLAAEAERLRILDPVSHEDLVDELCWSEAEHHSRRVGIPFSALSISDGERAGLNILRDPAVAASLATWNGGTGLRKMTRDILLSSAAIGIVWSPATSRRCFLNGGRALQRIWLQATADGIGLCPISSLCYLLNSWRSGHELTPLQRAAMPELEAGYREITGLPSSRSDITLFRLLPETTELSGDRPTLRLPPDGLD